MFNQMRSAFLLLVLLTLLTGLIYPLIVTGIAQLFFPITANGSLIEQNGIIIGSKFIGQSFESNKNFWGRISATTPHPYLATSSSGSNLGPTNQALFDRVKKKSDYLKQHNPNMNVLIPVDLVTASGSGLDPEISPSAAYFQVARIAQINNIPEDKIKALVQDSIKNRTLGILGEPRVNVLELNLALQKLRSVHERTTTQP